MTLLQSLDASLDRLAAGRDGELLLVAFSGGSDSTALLGALHELAPQRGFEIIAAHLDHGLDAESAARAAAAQRAAQHFGIDCRVERLQVDTTSPRGLEDAGRRARYAFLERIREATGARWIATAHHQDDQAETVLLRLLFGSGLDGLGAMRARSGRVLRPLLDVPRRALLDFVIERRHSWSEDATNADLGRPRSRIRHSLLPRLADTGVDAPRLARLATLVADLRSRLDLRFAEIFGSPADGRLSLRTLQALPPELLPQALAWLHRHHGVPYPPSAAAVTEVGRQIAARAAIGCDCGAGWRWQQEGDSLSLRRSQATTPPFSYTLAVPGEVKLKELGLRFRIRASPISPWMFRRSTTRAGVALPLQRGDRVTIRSRRTGDRIRPLGWSNDCRVKNLLINRQVPQPERARLPLLCHDGTIAWIPGIAVHESFRLPREGTAWAAEILPA